MLSLLLFPLFKLPIHHNVTHSCCGHSKDTYIVWDSHLRRDGYFQQYFSAVPFQKHIFKINRRINIKTHPSVFITTKTLQISALFCLNSAIQYEENTCTSGNIREIFCLPDLHPHLALTTKQVIPLTLSDQVLKLSALCIKDIIVKCLTDLISSALQRSFHGLVRSFYILLEIFTVSHTGQYKADKFVGNYLSCLSSLKRAMQNS